MKLNFNGLKKRNRFTTFPVVEPIYKVLLEKKNYYNTLFVVMMMDTKWTHKYKKKSRNLVYQVFRDDGSDLDWVKTYSVNPDNLEEPQGFKINRGKYGGN